MSSAQKPSAKRKRLDESSTTLSKPFRSPMRVDVKAKSQQTCHTDHNHVVPSLATAKLNDSNVQIRPTPPSENEVNTTRTPQASSPSRKPPPLFSSSPKSTGNDAEFLALQREHSALRLRLAELRQSLDTAQQALKIQTADQDAGLEVLIAKWKQVSREVAEQLFTTAKEKVNRMGGVGVWREKSRKKPGWWDDTQEEDEEELSPEQKEQREIQREEWQAEMKKYGTEPSEEVVEADDEVSRRFPSLLEPHGD
jgi:hypothetical protein